jgi:hypothetical protein
VEEARGRVTDYRGGALDLKGRDVLASIGLLHLEYTSSTPTHANEGEQMRVFPEANKRFCRYF